MTMITPVLRQMWRTLVSKDEKSGRRLSKGAGPERASGTPRGRFGGGESSGWASALRLGKSASAGRERFGWARALRLGESASAGQERFALLAVILARWRRPRRQPPRTRARGRW